MKWFLVFLTGEHLHKKMEVTDAPLLMGRSRVSNIKLESPDISGRHVILRVCDGALTIENLSSQTTRLNEKYLQQRDSYVLHNGDVIQLGQNLSFQIISEDETIPENLKESPKTEYTLVIPPVQAVQEDVTLMFSPQEKMTSQPTEMIPSKNESIHPEKTSPETIFIQTRAVSVDELEILRRKGRGLPWRSIIGGLFFAILMVSLAVIIWYVRLPERELSVSFRKHESGEPAIRICYPETPFGRRFLVYYPDAESSEFRVLPDSGILIQTKLGQDNEVDFHIRVSYREVPECLTLSRLEHLKKWIETKLSSGERWNFSEILPVRFLKNDGLGIPYSQVEYTRDDNENAWFGVLSFLRFGKGLYVIQKEVDVSEKHRTGATLREESCMSFERSCFFEHWEGGELLSDARSLPILAGEFKGAVDKDLPSLYLKNIKLARGILSQSLLNENIESYRKALKDYVHLRENMEHFYQRQCLRIQQELSKNRIKSVNTIRNHCKSIFSDKDDLRFWKIREDDWGNG